jgi:hypothetical protein
MATPRNMLRDGVTWLAGIHKQYAATPITYTRGANSVALTAVLGKTDSQLADGQGRQRNEWADRDYLIVAAELILGGAPTTPQKGDHITDGVQVREVVPADNEPHARDSDQFGVRVRVHTKRVA